MLTATGRRLHIDGRYGGLPGIAHGGYVAGTVALADAVVSAHEARTDEADALFADAHATFERYRLRGEQADALHHWGRALGDAEKLDQALELYRRHDAGQPWIDRVEADR